MKMMTSKSCVLVFGSFLLSTQLRAQVTITLPGNNAILTSLSSVSGTAPKNTLVKISIVKKDSDDEWAYDEKSGTYRWIGGPTGQWLSTISNGTTWTAPGAGYSLPTGTDLPPGKYIIYAKPESGKGGQVHRDVMILPDLRLRTKIPITRPDTPGLKIRR